MGSKHIHLSKWRTILFATGIGGSFFVWGLIYSGQNIFYTDEALRRGANLSEVGFVFGLVHISGFITASVISLVGDRFSFRKMSFVGAFGQGIAVMAFGMLDFTKEADIFVTLSYLLRSVEGICSAIGMSAYTAIFIQLYPDRVGAINSWSGTMLGIGYCIGPVIGGLFYDCGGFYLPFMVIGILGIIFSIFTLVALPHEESKNSGKAGKSFIITSPKILQKKPQILIPYIDCIVCSMGIAMLGSTYSQYFDSINAEQFVVRTTFILIGISNFVGKFISGSFLDQTEDAPVIFSLVGNSLMLMPYITLGTLPYWPISQYSQQWVIFTTSPLLSCGFVFVYISTFSRMYNVVASLVNAVDTSALISGMWTSSSYLGMFLGPSIGGILIDNYGFQEAAFFFSCLFCVTLMIDFKEFLTHTRFCYKFSNVAEIGPVPIVEDLQVRGQINPNTMTEELGPDQIAEELAEECHPLLTGTESSSYENISLQLASPRSLI